MDDFNELVSKARVIQAREEVCLDLKSALERKQLLLASLNQLIAETESKLIELHSDMSEPRESSL